MTEQVFVSSSPEETRRIGRLLGESSKSGEVYRLDGDLGAGKTVFSQGFAEGLGIKGPVTSPTFTIIQCYDGGRLPLYHMDVYRLEDEEEMEAIGGDEMLGSEGVCLVEWGSRIEGILPAGTKCIRIERDPEKGDDYRRITLSGEGI